MPEPRLHLVLRSYGGENRKDRPDYYSKLLTLTSFVRAASRVPEAEVVFLNDGPVPAERLQVMERFGRVEWIEDGPVGLRRSYRHALALPDRLGWPDSDVVSYNEDDYLFTERAFLALRDGVHGLPQAHYFTVYGEQPDPDDPRDRYRFSLPRDWQPGPDVQVGDDRWFNLPSSTSTFTARVGSLRRDRPVFLHCMIPFRNRFLDHETCLMYQGSVPYHGVELLLGLPEYDPWTPRDRVWTPRAVVRTVVLIPFRAALDVHALLRRGRRHPLYALARNEATHLEDGVVSADQDWPAVAAGVADWAEQNGLGATAATLRERLGGPVGEISRDPV